MKKVVKWGVIIFVGLIILGSLVGDEEQSNNEVSNTSPAVESNTEEQIDKEPLDISWEIYNVEDSSWALAERFAYTVVIHEPVTPEEIKRIGRNVIEVAKIKTPFNALSIPFYDYPEFTNGIYTLAQAEMAPKGEWAEADTVETGDYGAMEVSWDINEKDWSDQLTSKEAKIYGRSHEILMANPDWTDEEINEATAEEFDVTAEEVMEIFWKKVEWARQDLSD